MLSRPRRGGTHAGRAVRGSRLLPPLRVFLLAAIAVTVGVALYMAQPWDDPATYGAMAGWLPLAGFVLWAASPLAMLAWSAAAFARVPLAMAVFAAGATAIAFTGLHAYAGVAFFEPDAQSGLAFVFVPLVQWGGALCLGGACLWLRRREASRR